MFLAVNEAENIEIYDTVCYLCIQNPYIDIDIVHNAHEFPIGVVVYVHFFFISFESILKYAWVFHSANILLTVGCHIKN